MARTLDIVVPPDRTERLLRDVERLEGVVGVRVSPGASRRPPGDVVTLLTTNVTLLPLVRLLEAHDIPAAGRSAVTLSEPSGVLTRDGAAAISEDSTEIPWEEMEYSIARESNMWPNSMVMMAAAGIFAAVGLATSALHLVVAAMLIAPGFEPIVRVALAIVSRAGVWRRGIKDFLMGYSALLAGAAGATVLMLALGVPLEDGSYLEAGILPSYWMQVTIPSVIISIVAGFAGAVLIANNRSILTAGVMIALSLVPTIAMAGMGLVRLDPWSSVRAAGIWLIDVAIVLAVSVLAFVWKRRAVQRRLMSA